MPVLKLKTGDVTIEIVSADSQSKDNKVLPKKSLEVKEHGQVMKKEQ